MTSWLSLFRPRKIQISNRRLDGKTVIITGANGNIGKETAKGLAIRGAKVIMACRDMKKSELVRHEIVSMSGNKNVVVQHLDLGSLESVRRFAGNVLSTESHLDVLINNAGHLYGYWIPTAEGYESHFAVNVLGHFLLTNLLIDRLVASSPSRIINIVHPSFMEEDCRDFRDPYMNFNYTKWRTFSRSMAAKVLFSLELNHRYAPSGVTTYAVFPGRSRGEFYERRLRLYSFLSLFMNTPSECAKAPLFFAVEENVEHLSGQYLDGIKPKPWGRYVYSSAVGEDWWTVWSKLVKLRHI